MSELLDVVEYNGDTDGLEDLPDHVRQRIDSVFTVNSCVILVARGTRGIVGVLLGCKRGTSTALRISFVWVAPNDEDRQGIACSLISGLDVWSSRNDALSWRIGASSEAEDIPDCFRALSGIPVPQPGTLYMQKALSHTPSFEQGTAPLYTQSTDFTCGPACLVMAAAQSDKSAIMARVMELELWREATSIVSLDGPGGCDPYGLALAAASRGFHVRVFMSSIEPILIERDDTEADKNLISFIQSDFKKRAIESGVVVENRAFAIEELRRYIRGGAMALVLIDQIHTHGKSIPHWVLAHSVDHEHFLINDPWFALNGLETPCDVVDLPIRDRILDRMCWYGEMPCRAAVVLQREPNQK